MLGAGPSPGKAGHEDTHLAEPPPFLPSLSPRAPSGLWVYLLNQQLSTGGDPTLRGHLHSLETFSLSRLGEGELVGGAQECCLGPCSAQYAPQRELSVPKCQQFRETEKPALNQLYRFPCLQDAWSLMLALFDKKGG